MRHSGKAGIRYMSSRMQQAGILARALYETSQATTHAESSGRFDNDASARKTIFHIDGISDPLIRVGKKTHYGENY